MSRPTPDIELHIEELVLHGVAASQRDAVAAQLVAALEPALAERGLGAWATDGAAIDRMTATTSPAVPLGAALATTLGGKP